MFYVIPTESFEPVVTTLKRLEDYDLAEKYDPQERENIVNLIAAFEQHIRQQSATNILGAIQGFKVLAEKQLIPAEVVDAVEAARRNIKVQSLRPAEIKKLVEDPDKQITEISRLLRPPKPVLDQSDFPKTGD
jgi:crotonobetainyl-CoA:carnitine CoA-transferase CaiB-like acyl-CoA transferase